MPKPLALAFTRKDDNGRQPKCQKCHKTGHWTFECSFEGPEYVVRPSFTSQLGKRGTTRAMLEGEDLPEEPEISFLNRGRRVSEREPEAERSQLTNAEWRARRDAKGSGGKGKGRYNRGPRPDSDRELSPSRDADFILSPRAREMKRVKYAEEYQRRVFEAEQEDKKSKEKKEKKDKKVKKVKKEKKEKKEKSKKKKRSRSSSNSSSSD